MKNLIPHEQIESKIFLIRGYRVMLDRDLARLYAVSTGRLNEQVKRNKKRFPSDFMFQLTKEETENWKSQFAISNSIKMGLRHSPYVFTQEGVAMLSGVLSSNRAIQVNIQIMRVFIKLREIISLHKELAYKLAQLEGKYEKHDRQIHAIFEQIRQFLTFKEKPKKRIGFCGG
ncbi:MAG: ORF6N domain-containing protein [Elusimicrobia bacterium]|nr:ORF6N domain-containing protein [Elusimicrobiota bacterium]